MALVVIVGVGRGEAPFKRTLEFLLHLVVEVEFILRNFTVRNHLVVLVGQIAVDI